MANGLRIIPDSIADRQRNSTTFNGSYQKLGGPLLYACPLLKFVNNSNTLVTISWDGINDHDVLPSDSFALYDFCSDAGTTRGLYAPQGTQFWVKGPAAPGVPVNAGIVYLVVFYTSEF